MKHLPLIAWAAALLIIVGLWLSQTTQADWQRFWDCDGASPGETCSGL